MQKHKPSSPEAIIFDLDGTIVDTAPDIATALNALMKDLRLPPYSVSQTALMIGRGVAMLIERALRPYDKTLQGEGGDALVEKFKRLYAANVTNRTTMYEGVREALEQAKARGAKIGMCTNKPDALTHAILRHFEIAPFFASVVAGDSDLPRKPDPAPLLHALKEMGSDPANSVMVGDSTSDVEAARGAGVGRVVVVTYGYTIAPPSELGGDILIDRIDGLADALDALEAKV